MSSVDRIAMAFNNVYVVEGGAGRVLVDTGPDYQGAHELLESRLADSPDVVVATHGHLDHAGLGHYWRRRGIPVAIGAGDAHLARAPQLGDDSEFDDMTRFVRSCGVPMSLAGEVIAGLEQRRAWALTAARPGPYAPIGRDGRWPTALHYEHFEPTTLLADGETVGGSTLAVIHCPGHTPGNLVLVEPNVGWLFSGDQLLPEITPTPAIQHAPPEAPGDWRFRSLPAFAASLERLRHMEFTRCFPGHGEPFDNVAEVIDANIAQIEQRTERVEDVLRDLGEASLYAVCESLYPKALRRRFWQIVATVQGHLDILEAQGRAGIGHTGYRLI